MMETDYTSIMESHRILFLNLCGNLSKFCTLFSMQLFHKTKNSSIASFLKYNALEKCFYLI